MSLSISGTTTYRLQGGVATVEMDRVTYTGSGVSGTIRIELWATTTPYSGGTISGYRIADYIPASNGGRLSAGSSFVNLRFSDQYNLSNGQYYLTVVASEYTGAAYNNGFTLRDSTSFARGVSVGPVTPPPPIDPPPTDPDGGGLNRIDGSPLNDDPLWGTDGNEAIFGHSGNDNIYALNGNDEVYGGFGNDTISLWHGSNLAYGDFGADLIYGGRGNDKIFGGLSGDEADTLHGAGGRDTLRGDMGNDVLYGGDGNDLLSGNQGNDRMFGEKGNDRLFGGGGRDTLAGGEGQDTLRGGSGDDELSSKSGDSELHGEGGRDWIAGGSGKDRIYGGTGRDSLFGGQGNDRVYGGAESDTLFGDQGNDMLSGGKGDDWLVGGRGADSLTGGGGADRFEFIHVADAPTGSKRERITDFSREEGDQIDLSEIDANTRRDGDQAFKFIKAAAFSGKAGELRFANGTLSGDVDGDRRADFAILIPNVANLRVGDFDL